MISTSPLCPHIEVGSGRDWISGLSVKPKAVLVFSAGDCWQIKDIDPNIITLRRRWVADQDHYLNLGAEGGRQFVREQPTLDGVDILLGLNECVPSGNVDAIRKANEFHLGFVEECARHGVKPCVLNIAVGNPEVVRDGEPWEGEVKLIAPCVQAALDAGGYVGYHSYGPADLLYGESWYTFRDVLRIEPLLRESGVNGPIRWIHTEAGYDTINDPHLISGSWGWLLRQGYLRVDQMKESYEAYARRCLSRGVEIACVFTFWGNTPWRDYDHVTNQELMAWFADHWARWREMGTLFAKVVGTDGQGLRVRLGPGTNKPVLGVLPEDGRWFGPVEELPTSPEWVRAPITSVSVGGASLRPSQTGAQYGYMLRRYLEIAVR